MPLPIHAMPNWAIRPVADLDRYKRVIAVVGFNPDKKYKVTPEQRKDLLEKMVATTSATNIDVEGSFRDGWIQLTLNLFRFLKSMKTQ